MIYNAEGDMVSPLIPHKADVPQAVLKHFSSKFNFFQTDNGDLDRNCLRIMLLSIKMQVLNLV